MRKTPDMIVVLVAALMLALQSAAGAFALGQPTSPLLDRFGNPLCITSADHAPGEPERHHGALPDCCSLTCGMFAPATGATPEIHTLTNPLQWQNQAASSAYKPTPLTRALRSGPGSPRAPPLDSAA